MSNDANDIQWRCGCGHTSPDFDLRCNGCGEARFEDDLPFDQMHGDSEDLKESPMEDVGFRVVYSDEDIDRMEQEQNTIEIRPTETFISYDLPLKPEMAAAFKLVESMYENTDGSPLKPFVTESTITLHIPRSIRRKAS